MKKEVVFCFLGFLVILGSLSFKKNESASQVKAAVVKSVELLQNSSHTFIGNAGCYSCHGQSLPSVAVSLAKQKGIVVNDSFQLESLESMINVFQKPKNHTLLIEGNKILGGSITMGYSLWSLSSANYPSEKSIALLVQLLLQRQTADGQWLGGNGRPPLEYYSVSATALAIKGIIDYATPGMQKQVNEAKQRGLQWMTQVQTPANEEKAFQLLGLSWMNAPKTLIKDKAKLLLLKQHSNGGWSQLDSLDPDAYATGQALYALHESGVLAVTDTYLSKRN